VRPGVNVTTRDNAPPSTIPTDVSTGFMVGVTEFGPSQPTSSDLVQNMDEFTTKYNPSGRSYNAGLIMHDSAEMFFDEGGNRLFVGRVVGPAAAPASVALKDSGATLTAITVTARGTGEWGNNLDIHVVTSTQDPTVPVGAFRLQIWNRITSQMLDASPDLVDAYAAISWAVGSIVQVTAGASTNDPVGGTFSMAGGTNDVNNVTDTSWQNAFNSLSYALGPGILTAPGATASTVYNMAAEAARSQLRVALLDGPDTPIASTVISASRGVADAERLHSRYAGMFAPWVIVPGSTSGTVRKVPPSPMVAGIFARNMASGYSANEPAAGELGRLRQALLMTQTYTDSDRQNMNANGVNVLRDIYGIYKVYGWRTTADPINDPRWISLNNSIMHRQIVSECNAVGERFIFREIDGQGHLIGEFNGALVGEVCLPLFMAGSLYGAAPEDAFKVDTGPSVNTDTTISNNELHAVVSVRMAPFGEEVDIQIVKYLITEQIPA